jgi:hypothetical protein
MKTKKKDLRIILGSVIFCYMLTSCTVVKPYQKVHINDADMALSPKKVEKLEQSFQLYREGASGANGGKSGGGCGCN